MMTYEDLCRSLPHACVSCSHYFEDEHGTSLCDLSGNWEDIDSKDCFCLNDCSGYEEEEP